MGEQHTHAEFFTRCDCGWTSSPTDDPDEVWNLWLTHAYPVGQKTPTSDEPV